MKLTDSRCKKYKDGMHSDGGGLYLEVLKSGTKRFLFRWTDATGKRAKKALGIFPDLSLFAAREKATEMRRIVAEGGDPRQSQVTQKTFGEFAREYIADNESGWKNDAHKRRWKMQLLGPSRTPPRGRQMAADYCESLRPLPISIVGTADILRVLKPVWLEKQATAERLRINLELVLDAAAAAGLRSGDNPARWRGHLKHLLPKQKKVVRHQLAMDYKELPAFVAQLQQKAGVSPRALEMCILTGVRSKEIRGAHLAEFDFRSCIWTIPADRMKRPAEHQVPLTPRMIEIVKMRIDSGAKDYIFAGTRSGKPITDAALAKPLKGLAATVHGMRSSFRDWVGEETEFNDALAELALHHVVGNRTVRAYRRGSALERRRMLMKAWEEHCLSETVERKDRVV